MSGPCETPVQDLLRRIPKGLTVGINDGEFSWSNHPVADLAYRAADEIDILRHRAVADKAIIKHLKDENERLKAVLMTESEKRDLLSKEHYRTRIAELEAQVESQGNWIRTANRVMSKLKKENEECVGLK